MFFTVTCINAFIADWVVAAESIDWVLGRNLFNKFVTATLNECLIDYAIDWENWRILAMIWVIWMVSNMVRYAFD